jgi:hypothetical protein
MNDPVHGVWFMLLKPRRYRVYLCRRTTPLQFLKNASAIISRNHPDRRVYGPHKPSVNAKVAEWQPALGLVLKKALPQTFHQSTCPRVILLPHPANQAKILSVKHSSFFRQRVWHFPVGSFAL